MSKHHETHWERLGAFVTRLMEKEQVPGVAVGVLHKDEMSTAGFGVTNMDHPLPVTDETHMCLDHFG